LGEKRKRKPGKKIEPFLNAKAKRGGRYTGWQKGKLAVVTEKAQRKHRNPGPTSTKAKGRIKT